MTPFLDFSAALREIKLGKKVYRQGWNNPNIFVRAQFPDENSMNTEPYLIMEKGEKVFPLDLSCESIFATDWLVLE
jgi:hypothetical protein